MHGRTPAGHGRAFEHPHRLIRPLRRVTSLVAFYLALSVMRVFSADVIVFGPQTYQRETGQPVTVHKTFSVQDTSQPYTLRVRNQGVTSALISVNGQTVMSPAAFSGNNTRAATLTRSVTLRPGANDVAVELRGKPGTSLTVDIISAAPAPPPLQVTSSVLSDHDGQYPTGRVVRIDVTPPDGSETIDATIQITSGSSGYDSGVQEMSFGSPFYLWDTSGLAPATDYVILIRLTNVNGQVTVSDATAVTLAPNPPVINKLVSDVDLSVDAVGVPVRFVRSYLLDSTFQGPLGYGWTHSYRMRAIEIPAFSKIAAGVLISIPRVVQIFNADGTGSYFFPNPDGSYKSPKGDFRTLSRLPGGSFDLRSKFGVHWFFAATGELLQIQDPSGNVVQLAYDAAGLLAAIHDASGQVTTLQYDATNRVERVTDPAGRSVTYAYDGTGNLASVADIGGHETHYAYDASHNLTTITDPLGKRVFFTADSEDRLESVSGDGGENRVAIAYDTPAPSEMTITDALGKATVITYDANASVTKVVDPLGNTTTITYDTELNLTSSTDAAGHTSRFTYDAGGNLLNTTDALGHFVTLSYEPSFSRIASLTDANGNVTTFTYDGAGRLLQTSFPNSAAETFTYDAAGNLASRTDRKGQTIDFAYDAVARLIRKSLPDGTSQTFEYDDTGNMTSATDANGTIRFTYDPSDRVTQAISPGGEVVSYAYDAAGNRTRLVYPDAMTLSYQYDSLNRLVRIQNGADTVATYAYDLLSRVLRRDLQNGTYSTYGYDEAGRLVNLSNRRSTSDIISSFAYSYDSVGNRATLTTLEGVTRYGYDALSQLVSVINPSGSTVRYDFDAAGNRTAVTGQQVDNYITNAVNQYVKVGPDGYEYDANGSLIRKTAAAGVTTYSYDFESRLIQVSSPTETVRYVYDPFGRRISKTTSAGTTRYIHDGLRVILEKNGGGVIQASYLHGRWIDEVVLMNRGAVDYFYSQDGLGSVTGIIDSSGHILETYAYDVYGLPTTTGSLGNPYLFTGREYDPEVGLYYYRARYYEPRLGRFLTTDPIRRVADPHLYAYVGNNPINYVDPLGLFTIIDQDIDFFGLTFRVRVRVPPPLVLRNALNWIKTKLGSRIFHFEGIEIQINQGDLSVMLTVSGTIRPLPDDETGAGGNFPCGQTAGCAAGDPTFVQAERVSTAVSKQAGQRPRDGSGLRAAIRVPFGRAIVRANVPVFGVASGPNFQSYRVEYGEGDNPHAWTVISESSSPTIESLTERFHITGDTTIKGNLATWDTGLTNYVYLPTHPRGHPIDLKGRYTVRLVVTGKNGKQVEDRTTVTVADVIPNALGGQATSKDGRVVLSVPEQAIAASFRLISFEATEEIPKTSLSGRTVVGPIYRAREAGEAFTKPAVLEMGVDKARAEAISAERLGLYGFNATTGAWEHLATTRSRDGKKLRAEVQTLQPFYAVMASDVAGEGSALASASTERSDSAAALHAEGGRYLVNDTFENGMGQWSNRDGDAGGQVALDHTITADGGNALKVTPTKGGGNFAVNVVTTPFDVRTYPAVQFEYRIGADVKTNFLVKVAGRWYDIGFTDDAKDLKWKRVNIGHVGDIPGIQADNQWHTATFNLYDMLRTKTGNTVVEQMVMADWDVLGYMKLTYGHNTPGATYYIDNFSISRADKPTPPPALDHDRIVIDDFDGASDTNALGGATDIFQDLGAPRLKTAFSDNDERGRGRALTLTYDVSADGSFAGYTSALPDLDLRGFQALSFYVKSEKGERQEILVGLQDRNGQERKIGVGPYVAAGITGDWQLVRIPLAAFSSDLDWSAITKFIVAFEKRLSANGTVLVDSVAFERELAPVLIEDFDRGDSLNRLGGKSWTFAYGAAAINGTLAKTPSRNGVFGLSFGGNIGDVFGYDSGLNYAGWTTELRGVDCARCQTLSLRIRGAQGGERPNIYLDDGNFRWPVSLSDYATVTTDWQDVTIPLADFAEYGVDLSHLAELQVVFEWEHMSGTVYLDDIRLGSSPSGQPSQATWDSK